jgi:hypothetical protein
MVQKDEITKTNKRFERAIVLKRKGDFTGWLFDVFNKPD